MYQAIRNRAPVLKIGIGPILQVAGYAGYLVGRRSFRISIFAKDISSAYDDKSLEFEIRKSNLINGVKYIFYDTLKDDVGSIGDWSGLKITTTKLSELAKQLDVFIYGSIQLTDDTNFIEPDELTSSNISNCKQLKYVLDTLVLFKEVPKVKYGKYTYLASNTDWGEPTIHMLELSIKTVLEQKRKYYLKSILTLTNGMNLEKFLRNRMGVNFIGHF